MDHARGGSEYCHEITVMSTMVVLRARALVLCDCRVGVMHGAKWLFRQKTATMAWDRGVRLSGAWLRYGSVQCGALSALLTGRDGAINTT
jgi:hypothetical protein